MIIEEIDLSDTFIERCHWFLLLAIGGQTCWSVIDNGKQTGSLLHRGWLTQICSDLLQQLFIGSQGTNLEHISHSNPQIPVSTASGMYKQVHSIFDEQRPY